MKLSHLLLSLILIAMPEWLLATRPAKSVISCNVEDFQMPQDVPEEPPSAVDIKYFESTSEANESEAEKATRALGQHVPEGALGFRVEVTRDEQTGVPVDGAPMKLINFKHGTDTDQVLDTESFLDLARQCYPGPAYTNLNLMAPALGTIWQYTSNLYWLDLSNLGWSNLDFNVLVNQWGIQFEGYKHLASDGQGDTFERVVAPSQKDKRALVRIDLQGNHLGSASLKSLIELPKLFPKLEYIDLRNNELNYDALSLLIKAYFYNHGIQYLDLSGNLIDAFEEKQLEWEVMQVIQERMQRIAAYKAQDKLHELSPGQTVDLHTFFADYACHPDRLAEYRSRGLSALITDTKITVMSRQDDSRVLCTFDLPSQETDPKSFAFEAKALTSFLQVFSKERYRISECVLRIEDPKRAQVYWDILRPLWTQLRKKQICLCANTLDISGMKILSDTNSITQLVELIEDLDIRELIAQDVGMTYERTLKFFLALNDENIRNTSLSSVDLRNNPIQLRDVNAIEEKLLEVPQGIFQQKGFFRFRPGLEFAVKAEDRGLKAIVSETGIEVRERLEPCKLLATYNFPKTRSEARALSKVHALIAHKDLPFNGPDELEYSAFVREAQIVFKNVFAERHPSITHCTLKTEDPQKAKDFFPHLAKYWHLWKENEQANEARVKRILGDFENELDISNMPIMNDEASLKMLRDLKDRIHLKKINAQGSCSYPDVDAYLTQRLQALGL